jgi:hypothetical protein
MRNPLAFFGELLKQPTWVVAWVGLQMGANLLSLYFWHEPISKIIFATFIVSATLMMALYSIFGFKKILGAGHILWIPLVLYMANHLGSASGAFQYYLAGLTVILAVSLAFDIVDVWKYFSSVRA